MKYCMMSISKTNEKETYRMDFLSLEGKVDQGGTAIPIDGALSAGSRNVTEWKKTLA